MISTLNWNSFRPGERSFVFLDNYKTVFTDTALRQAVVNTAIFTAAVVLISVALGLGIALLLDRKFRGRGLVRTMMIAPFLIVPVAAALLWKHALLNPDYGLLNGVPDVDRATSSATAARRSRRGSRRCRRSRSSPRWCGSGRRS